MVDVEKFYHQLANSVNSLIGAAKPDPVSQPVKPSGQVETKSKETPTVHPVPASVSRSVSGNLEGLQPVVLDFLEVLAKLMARYYPDKKLQITSGYRTPSHQSEIMADNWSKKGGKKPLDKNYNFQGRRHPAPFQISTKAGPQTVSTYGTAYLTDLYGDDSMAYQLGHALESDGQIDGKPWLEWMTGYWQGSVDKGDKSHMTGYSFDLAPAGFVSDLLSMSKKYADITVGDERDTTGSHFHVEVRNVSGDPDKQAVASIKMPLSKRAFQISTEPYNSLVNKELMEMASKLGPDYFSYTDKSGKKVQIDKVVLESGSPSHFGMVRSDNPSTIYISLDKIQSAMGNQDPAAVSSAIKEVLSHEMGHFKDNMAGGEGPAEAESAKIKGIFASRVAADLEKAGLVDEAALVRRTQGIRTAFLDTNLSPHDVAQSVLRIVYHFVQKVKPENQAKYVGSIARKVQQIDLAGLAAKNKNPGGGLGQAISLIKNILSGLPAESVQATVQELFKGLVEMAR